MVSKDLDPVEIVGRACRLPGAPDPAALWRVLVEGRCTVTEIGTDRWAKARYLNPRPGEPGKSYTFAAGVLDDIWGFDPAVFPISPREAAQMDPQQRLLLQVVWEALEDAGLPPVVLAGAEVGVYVGVSSPDASTRRAGDVGTSDPYLMTGSTLSLVANRLSYIFDWHGPSLSIDTACSSGLVALSQALDALQAGRIDTAVVAGVNVLLSPFPFLGFSAARMLSPAGQCRPFDADGEGYVRSEGAVAFVLRRADAPPAGFGRSHARIVAAGVNSDGRTSGVSLPSAQAQADLLARLYRRAGVAPRALAFVEAHGTGTRVGDPAEADAIGAVLAQGRAQALPIGSIKGNIGHLEPAAGLAGVLKATLAFEHGLLPPSIHCDRPNPAIPFAQLNLTVARHAVALDAGSGPVIAGVSAFGFGGTNAHVILQAPERGAPTMPGVDTQANVVRLRADATRRDSPGPLLVTAACENALQAQAEAWRHRLSSAGGNTPALAEISAAAARYREPLAERLAVVADSASDAARLLETCARTAAVPQPAVVRGRAVARDAPVAFVFSGNGSQWAGMARAAYIANAAFRGHFDRLAAIFAHRHDTPLAGLLDAPDLALQLASASVAQPLLFAIQAALSDALGDIGLAPDVVVGHSVGELAAAYAAGILDQNQAIDVIHARSTSQEAARGLGGMIAVAVSAEAAHDLIAANGIEALEVGAVNAPDGVTLTGEHEAIAAFAALAAARGLAHKVLDVAYPFHSRLVDVSRGPLLSALADLAPGTGRIPFVSTVHGGIVPGAVLDADYWWRNVRAPVQFSRAIGAAAEHGARVFVEIGPRAILQGYMAACLDRPGAATAVVPGLGQDDTSAVDPVRVVLARALVRGARFDPAKAYGAAPARSFPLPSYPWQNRRFDVVSTPETSTAVLADAVEHPLLGWRERPGAAEWSMHLDTYVRPDLAEHVVGGQSLVPGAVFCEMALAAAGRWLQTALVEVYDLDIIAPLVLAADHMKEVRTRILPDTRSIEIASRRRLSADDWLVHVRARFAAASDATAPRHHEFQRPDAVNTIQGGEGFYRLARSVGLDYGPVFRRLDSVTRVADGSFSIRLIAASGSGTGEAPAAHLIDPIGLDGSFHGLLCALMADHAPDAPPEAYVPVRFARVILDKPNASVRSARIDNIRRGQRQTVCDIAVFDDRGERLARLEGARFQSALFLEQRTLHDLSVTLTARMLPPPAWQRDAVVSQITTDALLETSCVASGANRARHEEARLLIEAASRRVAVDALRANANHEEELRSVLLESGLLVRDGEGWRLTPAADELPPLDVILQTVLADHPQWWPDAALLARADEVWRAAVDGGRTPGPSYSQALLDAFVSGAPRHTCAAEAIMCAIDQILTARRSQSTRLPLAILELGAGFGELSRRLADLATAGDVTVTLVAEDRRSYERLRAALPRSSAITLIAPSDLSTSTLHPADLVVSAGGIARFEDERALLAIVRDAMRSGAKLIATEAINDTFCAVVFGAVEAEHAKRGPGDERALASRLARCGFSNVVTRRDPAYGTAWVVAAGADEMTKAAPLPGHAVNVLPPDDDAAMGPIRSALTEAFRARSSSHADPARCDADATEPTREWVWCVTDDITLQETTAEPCVEAIADRLMRLARLAGATADSRARLWIVAPGAVRATLSRGTADPVAAAIWSAARTAQNEHPDADVRLVDIAAGLTPTAAAHLLADIIADPGTESEIVLTAEGCLAVRVEQGLALAAETPIAANATTADDESCCRLERTRDGAGARVAWVETARRAPAEGEVEIAVEATGLNFRDAMWSLGMLPQEALEDGYAGPTLGFECAGQVVRIGAGVSDIACGASVIAFAPAAFATHVTVSRDAVVLRPSGMPAETAATLPVAFLTAYYALCKLARLEPSECVLIHGAAGGVGLAALQVAQWRGARVIATAGTPEKRALLRRLGVDHALDSRSQAFADEVLALTGGAGVDVVLNALAGEAMEKSLALVKPFGRFLELGKRDFYGHTRIGLRPFRRNVSYHGIDADQLLSQRPQVAREVFSELDRHFGDGTFLPLPYRAFEAAEVADAFRLIQQSGHIGKIVVRAPDRRLRQAVAQRAARAGMTAGARAWQAAADGAHVIVGGTGGFGWATATWLADRGARTIGLLSRSGRLADEAQAAHAGLLARGVDVRLFAADVADPDALAAVLASLRRDGPICGIVHAAMQLDDALLANLTRERVPAALTAKVAGAHHLDRLTRQDPLDYFVLYSSITALIGNPGQAAYVAANAALEAIAQQRRADGRPALAVGWGGITDVGYLTRNADAGRAIARRTGADRFTAAEALDRLGDLLAMGAAAPATIAVAPMAWTGAAAQLPVLARPMFRTLVGDTAGAASAARDGVDLAEQIRGLPAADAHARVVQHLTDEIGRIFRMPAADIAADRALADLGMDSLMGLELRVSVQRRLGADIPLAAMAGNLTITEVAARICATLTTGPAAAPQPTERDLARQHLAGDAASSLDAERLEPLLREIARRERREAAS